MGLIKFSKYQGLHLRNYKPLIEDTSINSPDYFRITQFPGELTAGRNAFLIAGNSLLLEPHSEIKFECVASDGSNVYMEVPSWIDGSGSRMLVLYVYPWTPQGNGIITLVAKLRKGGHVRWKRLIKIQPYKPNVTPLVFGRKPKAFVQEKRKEYLNLTWPVGDTAEQQYTTGQIELVYNAVDGQTTVTLTGGGEFTSDMAGGHLVISNPNTVVGLPQQYGMITADPWPQTYDGYITQILSSTTALVNHPFEALNVTWEWDDALSSYMNDTTYSSYNMAINPSDYTLDYIQTPTYTTGSGNYESYALVTISNLEPISGDADRVVTYMRSAGFTEWEKIGDDSLNHKELLIDGGSHELTRKMGFFVDDYAKDTYWSSSAHGYTNTSNMPSLSRQSSSLMDALRISGSEEFVNTTDRANTYIRVSNTIPQTYYKDCEYQISFKFTNYTDLFDGFPPELVIFMSGSAFNNVDSNNAIQLPSLGKKVANLGEENTFSTWQEQVAAITTNENFVPGYTLTNQPYMSEDSVDAMMIANNFQGMAASPAFSGQVATQEDVRESAQTFWNQAGANIIPDPDTTTFTFTADNDGTGTPVFQIKAGRWDISQISVKAVAMSGFTPNHTFMLSHIPTEKIDDLLDFKWEFVDGQGNTSNTYLVTHSMNFSGSNTYIEEALLPGVFDIGPSPGDSNIGFQFRGTDSAIIRTMGPTYPGFSRATGSHGGGIIMWSGSLSDSGKIYEGSGSYYGVGLELVGSQSWLRFRTKTGSSAGAGGELDITTNKFFLGSERTSFISGSGDGTIAISSSNFELGTDGNVTMQGTITAEAGGTIGGWDITANTIEDLNPSGKGIKLTSDPSTPKIEIIKDASTDYIKLYHTTDSDWGIIGRENNTNVFLLGDPGGSGNKIAGWSFNDKRLSSWTTATADKFGISLDADYQLITIHGDSGEGKNNVGDNDRDNVRVAIGQLAANEFGIRGWSTGDGSGNSGKRIFELSSIRNEIAGWTIGPKHISSSNLLLSASGVIQTADFQSSEFGTGKGWKIGSDGKAEFEEAKIRGTLATTVFEKDTVSAVGGQLVISNATAVSGSTVTGSTSAETIAVGVSCLVPVDNASGFVANEYVMAKATASNGFTEEIMKVTAVSTTAGSNSLTMTRGQNGNIIPSMSSGQTLVSLGRSGTGYIHMNASPSSDNTPYMDIVERTGSGVNDISTTVRVGDLSGINDDHFADGVTGHGIYTTNGYFKGKIDVSAVPAAPFVSDSEIIHFNFAAAQGTTVINQAAPADNWTLYSGSIQGTVVWGSGSDAVTGTSLKLDEGNNCFIQVEDRDAWYPNGAVANILSQSFSVWFKAKNVAHSQPQIIWEAGGNTAGHSAYVSRSLLYYATWDESGNNANEQVVVSSSISSNKWYHAAGVYADGTSSLWLDGRRADYKENYRKNSYAITYSNKLGVGAVYHDSRFVANNENPYSAGTGDTGEAAFTGSIDELRIYYGKALSENEIKGLFGQPAGNAAPASTIIEGGRIKTGQIQSKNYGTDAGGEIDLDAGTITFGGSATSSFKVTSTGLVSATNFSEKFVTVVSANKSQYLVNDTIGGYSRTRIVCDGSAGGDVTLNLQLDVAPDHPIGDVKLPSQGAGTTTQVRIVVNVAGVQLDNGQVYGSSNQANVAR